MGHGREAKMPWQFLTTGSTKWYSSADPAWLLFRTSHYQFDFQPEGIASVSYLCPSWTGYTEKSWQLIKAAFCCSSKNYGWGHKSLQDLCSHRCPSPGLGSLCVLRSLTTAFSEDWSSSSWCWWRCSLVQDPMALGLSPYWNAQGFAQSK